MFKHFRLISHEDNKVSTHVADRRMALKVDLKIIFSFKPMTHIRHYEAKHYKKNHC